MSPGLPSQEVVRQVVLRSGTAMPQLGFGVVQVPREQTRDVVSNALRAGCRSIDAAAQDETEDGMEEAVAQSGLPSGRAPIAQSAEAAGLKPVQCGFESHWGHTAAVACASVTFSVHPCPTDRRVSPSRCIPARRTAECHLLGASRCSDRPGR